MNTTRRERVLLWSVAYAVIMFIGWRFMVDPVMQQRDQLKDEYGLIYEQLLALQNLGPSDFTVMGGRLDPSELEKRLPAEHEAVDLMLFLYATIESSGCQLIQLNYNDPGEGRAGEPTQLKMSLDLRGMSEELLALISGLENSERLLGMSSIDFNRAQASEPLEWLVELKLEAWYGYDAEFPATAAS